MNSPTPSVLHIGTEKTGSKTLQECLHRNRGLLLEQGVLYTRSAGLRNNRQVSLLGYAPDRRDDGTAWVGIDSDEALRDHQWKTVKAIKEEIQARRPERVVFSSEHLQSRLRTQEDIRRVHDQLEAVGVSVERVIVYLRDPVSVCRSLYASSVVTGSTASGPPPPDSPYFETICNHRKTLETWASEFGDEIVTPRLFARDSLRGGSIIDDFFEAAEMALPDDLVRPVDRNESLSQLGVEVLRRLNARIPRMVDGKINQGRSKLVELVRQYCTGPRYEAPPEIAARYREYFADSNEWVRRRYFPERDALFSRASVASPVPVNASEAELNGLVDLVAALWNSPR